MYSNGMSIAYMCINKYILVHCETGCISLSINDVSTDKIQINHPVALGPLAQGVCLHKS